jgi:large subunit ribosomal protein L24
MHIVKNDKVIVISGNHRGRTGEVLKVYPDKERVLVKGLNMVKRHQRPTQKNPQGGIVEKEAPIHVSNLMLFDDKSGKGVRISSSKLNDEKGSKVRISKKSGEVLPKKPRT